MRWSGLAWCLGVALLVFVPVGLRVLTWPEEDSPGTSLGDQLAGKVLFTHEWQPKDPLCAGGDGLGPVFNARSCAACHRQGGLGGGGGLEHNVTLFVDDRGGRGGKPREGVIHAHAVAASFQETLALLGPNLPAISQPSLQQILQKGRQFGEVQPGGRGLALPPNLRLTQRNTTALFGAGLINAIPDRVILVNLKEQRLRRGMAPGDTEHLPVGRVNRLADGRIGKFGWKAQAARLSDFVQAACANELGLSNPGHPQPQPLGKPDYMAVGVDLTQKQCDQLTAFVASLPQPVERRPTDPGRQASARRGKELFKLAGCAECHTPDLGSVSGIYSDLLLHRMGRELEASGSSYGSAAPPPRTPDSGPLPEEWRTPPLWGVAESAPYLHDGRAATLEEAIRLHAGQGARSALYFTRLAQARQDDLIAFLKTLRAPPASPR
jgi:CxxC motif-containing protein (DUF1111 family)